MFIMGEHDPAFISRYDDVITVTGTGSRSSILVSSRRELFCDMTVTASDVSRPRSHDRRCEEVGGE